MTGFIIKDHFSDLDPESKQLAEKAITATTTAYAPYSEFHVGAAVLLHDGTVVTGTNQENASYPAGMCAERVALYTVAALHPGKVIRKMAVVAKRNNEKEILPASSCGQCRQVMLEFEQRQDTRFQIVMQSQNGQWILAPSAESLLPFCFSKSSLERPK